MSSGERLPLAAAESLAHEVVALLEPGCQRIEIAGSIRRRKVDAGDIEIVCIPQPSAVRSLFESMFDGVTLEGHGATMIDLACDLFIEKGIFTTRPNKNGSVSVGSKLKWLRYRDFALDIYACRPDQWGVTLAIRTGDADFSRRLVTPTTQGGLCLPYLQFKDWRIQHRQDGEVIPTPEERDVFAALEIDYIAPEQRAGNVRVVGVPRG